MLSSKRSGWILTVACLLIVTLSPLPATLQVGFPVLGRSGNNLNFVNFTGSLTGTGSPCLDGSGNLAVAGCNTITGGSFTVASFLRQEMEVHDTVPFTALTAAATIMDIAGPTLPANFKVRGITVCETITFAGPAGLTAATVSLGPTGSETLYFPPSKLYQSAGTCVDYGGHYSSTASSFAIQFQFVNTTGSPSNFGNGSVTSLTAGSLDIYILGVLI